MLTSQPEFFGPLDSVLPHCLRPRWHHSLWPGQWGMDDGHLWGPQKSWASYNEGLGSQNPEAPPQGQSKSPERPSVTSWPSPSAALPSPWQLPGWTAILTHGTPCASSPGVFV